MKAQELTSALGGTWRGHYGSARCPGHKDASPSLSIRDYRDSISLKCFAGCSRESIHAGLRGMGIKLPSPSQAPKYASNTRPAPAPPRRDLQKDRQAEEARFEQAVSLTEQLIQEGMHNLEERRKLDYRKRGPIHPYLGRKQFPRDPGSC